MKKFVFFTAVDGMIEVHINKEVVGFVTTATQLTKLLKQNSVTLKDDLYNSSSIDFCSEEGFATDDEAHAIIDKALAKL